MKPIKLKVVIVIFIAILLVAGGVYFIFLKGGKLGAGKYGKGIDFGNLGEGTENALKDMPPTNPLEEVANPFRDAYQNPFK